MVHDIKIPKSETRLTHHEINYFKTEISRDFFIYSNYKSLYMYFIFILHK